MPNYLHRTTKQQLRSIAPADLPEPEANYIRDPDLSAVTGQPPKYWLIAGDTVTLMDQSARDAVDAAELSAESDSIADELDTPRTIVRAFAEVLLDELNAHALKINAILDAIDNANNLGDVKTSVAVIADHPQRSLAQLKTAVRSKL